MDAYKMFTVLTEQHFSVHFCWAYILTNCTVTLLCTTDLYI